MTGKSNFSTKKPLDVMSDFHIEIDKLGVRISLLLSGASAIRDFSDESALFRVRGFFVKVNGRGLNITVYENKTVELVGRIEGVEFIYDKA